MTKEEVENFIYNKIVEITIERHLNGAHPYYDSVYDEAEHFFRNEKNWYVHIKKETDTGYVSINLYSWDKTDNCGDDIYMYVNDIEETAVKQLRLDKINDLLY